MQHQAVIFDLYETLVYHYPVAERVAALAEMAAMLGLSVEEMTGGWKRTKLARMVGELPTIRDSLHAICETFGMSPGEEAYAAAAELHRACIGDTFTPRPDALTTLAALRERGPKIGLVSNCNPDVPGHWSGTPLAPYFDEALFSCSVGLKKPDPAIYRLAATRLGVPPAACLFVDDRALNVHSAAGVGMTAAVLRVLGEAPDRPYIATAIWSGPFITSLGDVLKYVP